MNRTGDFFPPPAPTHTQEGRVRQKSLKLNSSSKKCIRCRKPKKFLEKFFWNLHSSGKKMNRNKTQESRKMNVRENPEENVKKSKLQNNKTIQNCCVIFFEFEHLVYF